MHWSDFEPNLTEDFEHKMPRNQGFRFCQFFGQKSGYENSVFVAFTTTTADILFIKVSLPEHQRNWSALRGRRKTIEKSTHQLVFDQESWKLPTEITLTLIWSSKSSPYHHYSKSTWSMKSRAGILKKLQWGCKLSPLTDKKWDWRWWRWRKNKHNPRQPSSWWLDNILTANIEMEGCL